MESAKYNIDIDKKYMDLVTYICKTYNVDVEIDQYLKTNEFSKKRSYRVKVKKNDDFVDEQTGYDLDYIFEMLTRRLAFVFS